MRVYERSFDWDEAARLYATGEWTQTALAEKFGVTQMAIHFAVNPESYAKSKARSAAYLASGTCEECGGGCTINKYSHHRRGRELCHKCAARLYLRTRFRMSEAGLLEIRCTTCREWKGPSEFPSDKNGSDGYHKECRPCNSEAKRRWRESKVLACEVCGEKKVCPDGRRQTTYDVCRDCFNRLRARYGSNELAYLMRRRAADEQEAA